MAIANTTTASDLVIPSVWADFVAAKIPYAIKLRPLVSVDTTLQGQPGDEITYSRWDYIGDAEDLAESADVPLTKLGATQATATIKMAAKGIALTDKAVLTAAGAPTEEGTRQLVQSHAQKVDADIYAAAIAGAGLTANDGAETPTPVPFSVDAMRENLAQFGEWEPEQFSALVVSPTAYGELLGDPRFEKGNESGQGSTVSLGRLGRVYGIPVIQSARASAGALLVQPGSLGLLLKRDVLVERDRDIVNFTTIITSSMHYAATVPSPSGVMKFAADA